MLGYVYKEYNFLGRLPRTQEFVSSVYLRATSFLDSINPNDSDFSELPRICLAFRDINGDQDILCGGSSCSGMIKFVSKIYV